MTTVVHILTLGLVLAFSLAGAARTAHAQERELVIGMYAPSAPFNGPAQRVEFVRAVADHVAAQTGRKVAGRVFSAGNALSAAIKGGEVQFAIIDAPYGAAIGLPYDILGAAVRGDSATAPWRLVVGSGIRSLADLRGKTVAIPAVGARDGQFVANGLLEGEVDPSYFGKIATAPDAQSAVTLVGVGRAQAAFVPAGIDLPAGVRSMVTLNPIGWPMFVSAPGVDRATADKVGRAVRSFQGSGPFSRFASGDAGRYRSIDFGKPSRKGPMAVPPPARLNVREMLEGRTFNVELSNVLALVQGPE